jgi:small subunit ribosomal protein S15
MAITLEDREQLVKEYKLHETDTGSCEVQVALLTRNIQNMTAHLKAHPKDHHSRRGLTRMVNTRSSLLGYLRDQDVVRYRALIERLGLRK